MSPLRFVGIVALIAEEKVEIISIDKNEKEEEEITKEDRKGSSST